MAELFIYALITLDAGTICKAQVALSEDTEGIVITEILTDTPACQALADGEGPLAIASEDVALISF